MASSKAPSTMVIDYVPPPVTSLRVRQPAHKVSSEYIAKYNKATEIMRNLPPSDPRNFMQQANIHALYCDGPDGDKDGLGKYIQFLVHNSWLFFPFHRWYVYFYEKILGNLIGDPNFALPFWNWDHPDGMQIPDMYTDKLSALYDLKRSTVHQPPTTVDLDYHNGKAPKPRKDQVDDNYGVMYNNMVSGAKLPLLFFGSPYREGSKTSPGSIEKHPHNCVHNWTGHEITPQTPLGEDMGVFYSAGRDPIFFAHHANIDRMWNIWKTLDGPKRKDITDPDFLDTSFVFYDEQARLVRVKIRDCLNTEVLGYVYEKVELPWLKERGTPHTSVGVPRNIPNVRKVELTDFPITLEGSAVTIVVPRPAKKARSKEEKEEEEEVLVVEDISFDGILRVKFDVYVNDEYAPGPANSEFAGCFANVPHKHKHDGDHHHIHKVSLNLGITDLLDEIGADNDDFVFVTFVPNNSYPVTIGGIKLELLS